MNYFLFLLFIYFTGALAIKHPTNFFNNRQVIDELSGFKNCNNYDYQIKLYELSFDPYLIIIGKWFFVKSTRINKAAIQQEATIKSSFSFNDKTSIKQLDFCSVFRCPFVAGNFNETVLNIIPSDLKDPVNSNLIFDTKFEVYGADQMKLMCIEGSLAINFP